MNFNPKYGAYQQYSVSPVASVIPLPDDLGYEDASTLPLAIFTAAIGLFVKLGLNALPDTPSETPTGLFERHGMPLSTRWILILDCSHQRSRHCLRRIVVRWRLCYPTSQACGLLRSHRSRFFSRLREIAGRQRRH